MQHMHSLQGHQCPFHPYLAGKRLPDLSVRGHRSFKAARLASNVNGRTSSASERETGKRRSAPSTPAQKTAETKPHRRQSSSNSSAKANTQQQGNTLGTNQMSLQTPAAGPAPSSQTATLPPSEAPGSASKAPSATAPLTSKAPVSSATASSQTEVGSPSRAPSINGKASNASSSSNLKTANKPREAEANVPDKRSDRSIVMPSSAAAQAATGSSVATSESAVRADRQAIGGAEPTFIIPKLPGVPPERQVAHLPLMLYIPGIDGTGMAASRQFPGLMDSFDFRSFSVPLNDRTPFNGLVQIIKSYLEAEVDVDDPDRPVYLLGESFGAVLALAVAHDKTDLVDRLVLVNPATSYEKSIWPRLGPALAKLPDSVYSAIPYALSPVLGNPLAMAAVNVDRTASLPTQAAQYAESLQKLIPQLGYLSKILPPAVLQWKLELLKQGNAVVKGMLPRIQQRVFLLTADGDLLIPSKEEGPRLQRLLPRCRLKVFPNASHALLQEADVNLAQLMKQQGFYVTKRCMSAPVKKRTKSTFGSANPIEKPTMGELDYYTEGTLANLKTLQSPVFLSTDEDGRVQEGCGGIPLDRPLLLVSNHQTFALDIGPLVEGLLRQTGLLPRGLTHPAVFQGNLEERKDNADPQSNVFGSLLTTFGSVEVGGRNFFKLMQQGECVLLYPGGVREAYKGRGEEYKLFWPKQPEFVRMAARFGATIVPFGGVGLDDGFNMLLEPKQIRAIPVLGKLLEDNAKKRIPPARRGTSQKVDVEELFIQPVPLPKLPQRLYFKFQKPIVTCPEDAKDPVRTQQIYDETKQSCEDAISYLRINRERDPYKDLFKRLFYERTWGGKKAPTFPLK